MAHGDLEYVKNFLVPAIWYNNSSGDWGTLANWNSGQAVTNPPAVSGQYASGPLPTPRLPGVATGDVTTGLNDTVILERPNASITVTLSSGSYNIRKLFMRETLNITGGSLTINYNPAYRPDTNAYVVHAGPLSAQFSGPVTLSGSGSLSVPVLQVDPNQTFTLNGGTLTFSNISLMPSSTTPAKILVSGDMNLNALSGAAATIANSSGSGSSGYIDLSGGTRSFNVSDGAADTDISIGVPISNGGLTKTGSGTMGLTAANTYGSGTTLSAGRLLVNNSSGSGTGSGTVTVNGGTLSGTGTIAGAVTVNSGGTAAPGTTASLGTLTLNSALVLNGTNFVRIDRNGGSPLADKLALTSGTLTYGGTLVVSNSGAKLTGGELFTIFSAGAYSGAFASTNLPALSSGLNWYLGGLTANGTIKVNRKPVVSGGNIQSTPGQMLQIPIATLIASATDPDGDSLSLAAFDSVTTNGIALSSDSTYIYYFNNANVADQFGYTISDGHGGSATGLVEIGQISGVGPSISSGPNSVSAIGGQNATFTVTATGTAPLSYQWRGLGTIIVGATTSTYTRSNVQAADAGTYAVVVTNLFNAVTSSAATLTVNYTLTASATIGGTVSRNPDQMSYAPNSTVTLTATTNSGYAFTGWSGDASGTVDPLSVQVTTNKAITANFASIVTDIILDNTNSAVTFNGTWTTGTYPGFYGQDYRWASTLTSGTSNAVYTPNISTPGYYDVFLWYVQGSNRSTTAPWSIVCSGGRTNIAVNQQANGSTWYKIAASVPFAAGTGGYVCLSNNVASGYVVIADAVRFTYVGPIPVASTTTLGSPTNPSTYGDSVTLTATVSGSGGTPTGTVTFKDGTATLGTGTLNGSGQATFATNKLSAVASPHSLTAVYGGDSNFNPSTSSVLSQTVNQKALSVTGLTAQNKGYDGTTTAILTGTPALSGVMGSDAVSLIGTAVGAFVDPNVGTGKQVNVTGLSTTGADSGNYSLAPLALTANITGASSTTTLISSTNPSGPGTNVTFTATVGSTAGTPAGNVVFLAGGVPFSTNGLASGVAAAGIASLPLGTNHISAQYAASGNFLGSAGSVDQVVKVFLTCSQTNLLLSIVKNTDSTFTLTFVGTPQAAYYVVASPDLTVPMSNWLSLAGSTNLVTNSGGLWQFTVTNTTSGQFYRGAALPCP